MTWALRILLLTWVGLAAPGPAPVLSAQEEKSGETGKGAGFQEDRTQGLFRTFAVPGNRTARDMYDDALRFLAQGRHASALPGLQRLLDHYANKVVRVPGADQEECIYHGIGREVDALLHDLSPEGRRIYRGLHEGLAARLLRRAAEARTPEAFLEVIQRYRHTASGRTALEALGDVYLERGDPGSAAHYYGLLAASPGPAGNRAFNGLKWVQALALAGQVQAAASAGRRCLTHPGSGTIEVHGRRVSLETLIQTWARDAATPGPPSGWPAFGPSADSTRLMAALRTLGRCEWQRLLNVEFDLDMTRHYDGRPAPFHPVVGRGKIFVHNGLRAWAFNLSDGTEQWAFPGVVPRSTDQPNARTIFSGVLHGERYFANLEVAVDTPEHYYHTIPIQKKIPARKLFAFHAETGQRIWSHAAGTLSRDLDPGEQDFLARVNIPSPPTAWAGTLYCGASAFEGKIYCYLTAIDCATGHLQWHTLVCTGQKPLNMFGRPMQEPVLGIPTVHDGVVYFTSNLGVVAAVDARLGRILWLSTYPQRKVRGQNTPSIPMLSVGWHLSPTFVHSGVVVTAPTDANRLFGLDAVTGRILWSVERQGRIAHRMVLGVRDGAVFASGTGVAAYDIKTGETLWEPLRLPREDQTTWRGAVTAEGILVPTEKHLHIIDPATGKPLVDPPLQWDAPMDHGGNLVVAEEDMLVTISRLVSSRTAHLNVFFNRRDRIRRLRERVRSRPEDPRLRLSLARTLARSDLVREAEIQFDRAIACAASHPRMLAEARRSRFDVLARLGKQALEASRFKEARAFVDKALEAGRGRSYTLDALRLKESLLHRLGDLEALSALYADLESAFPDRIHAFRDWGEIPVDLYARLQAAEVYRAMGNPGRSVEKLQEILHRHSRRMLPATRRTAGHYVVSVMANLIERHGRSVYARFDAEAEKLFRSGQDRGNKQALLHVITGYPNARIIDRARLAYAAAARRDAEPAEAVSTLRRFFLCPAGTSAPAAPDPATTAGALAELVLAYEDLGFHEAARALSHRLARDHGDTGFQAGGRTTTGKAFLAARRPLAPAPAPYCDRKGGDPIPVWSRTFPETAHLEVLEQTLPPRRRKLFLVSVADRDTGEARLHAIRMKVPPEPAWQVELPEAPTRVSELRITHSDGLILVPLDHHVLALDETSGATRWMKSYTHRVVHGVSMQEGVVVVVSGPADGPPGTGTPSPRYRYPVVEALEVTTGDTVWAKRVEGRYPLEPRVTGGHVVVTVRRKPAAVYVFDLLTGRMTGEHRLAEAYLGIDPMVVGTGRVLLSPDSRSKLELIGMDGKKPLWSRTLEGMDIDTLVPDPSGGLVVARSDSRSMRPPPRESAATPVKHLFRFDPRKPGIQWHLALEVESDLGTDCILRDRDLWILPVHDPSGRVALKAVDDRGKVAWETWHLFDQHTYQTPLSRVLGGVLAIGYNPLAKERKHAYPAHLVLVDPVKGKERGRWPMKESGPPKGRGIWPTDTGFFLAWPNRVDYYEMKTGGER